MAEKRQAEEEKVLEEQKEKILWVQGTGEAKEASFLFTLAGYLQEGSSLLPEVFCAPEPLELPPVELSPLDFRGAFYALSRKKISDGEKTLALRQIFQEIPFARWIQEYRQNKEEGLKKSVERELKEKIEKLLPEAKMKVALLIISEEEYQSWQGKKLQMTLEGGEEEEEKKPIEITLKMQVAIDPVGGRSVTELYQGEKILVRLSDERPLGQYLAKLLSQNQNSDEGRLIAEAKEVIKMPTGRYKLLAGFGPGLFGECILSENIKVKVVKEAELVPEILPKILGMPVRLSPYLLGEVILLVLLFFLFVLARLIS